MKKSYKINKLSVVSIFLITLVSFFTITGCGSSGGGSAPQLADGFYTGTLDLGGGSGPEDVIAMVYDGVVYVDLNRGELPIVFTPTLSGTTFTASGKAYDDAAPVDITLSGDFTETTITGTYTTPPNPSFSLTEQGPFSLTFSTKNNQGSDLAQALGTFTWATAFLISKSGVDIIGTTTTLTLTPGIDAYVVNGSDVPTQGDNCNYTGSMNVVDTTINVYTVTLSTTDCTASPDHNATFTGLGALMDTDSLNDTLRVIATNSSNTIGMSVRLKE